MLRIFVQLFGHLCVFVLRGILFSFFLLEKSFARKLQQKKCRKKSIQQKAKNKAKKKQPVIFNFFSVHDDEFFVFCDWGTNDLTTAVPIRESFQERVQIFLMK